MPRVFLAVLVSVATLGLGSAVTHSAAATPPTQHIAVSGTDVAMYPAFTAATHRYGVTTATDTGGVVTVHASTTDPAGTEWIDGKRAAGGTATLSGLSQGDEISVFIKDSAGTAVYSLIYLPAGFPTLTVVTKKAGIAPGDVFLTPTDFGGVNPSFETAVDNNGVPVYVRKDGGVPLDFKRQPNGEYSVARQPSAPGQTNSDQIIELNSQFQQVGAFFTDNKLTNTDGHDSILLPNGDRWLIGSEPSLASPMGNFDGVIQEQSPTGAVLFQWNTMNAPPFETVLPNNPDYAHLNSIWLMKNGDILASFRHFDQVMEIATSARDGVAKGGIVWSLGGRNPTLTTVNDPDDGPCAQHEATQLPNGDILMFDDGSESIGGSAVLCVNPADPTGPAISRPQTRVTEYSINLAAHTATLVWHYQITGRDANFEGGAQRLSNGNTLIGWGPNTSALATEVNAKKQVVWELKDTAGLFSYRALRFPAPDAIKPAVKVTAPAPNPTYAFGQHVASNFSCTDQGGSSLQSCNGPVAEGSPIDTSTAGTHTFAVVAKDGAGNTRTVTTTYHVGLGPKTFQPNAMIKGRSGGFVGAMIVGGVSRQHVTQSIRHGKSVTDKLRVVNGGGRIDRFTLHGSRGSHKFHVAYFHGAKNITKAVRAGTYRTPDVETGQAFGFTAKITRTAAAKSGNTKTVKLTATSTHDTAKRDAVEAIVRAKR